MQLLVLCRSADGRIVSLELVKALREAIMPTVLSSHPVSRHRRGTVGRSVRCGWSSPAGSAPITSPACPLYCQAGLRHFEGGRGEAFAVAGLRDASVVWAGGLHSGRNARMSGWGSWRGLETPRAVPPHGFLFILVFAIQAPPFRGWGAFEAPALSLSLLLLCYSLASR